VCVVGEWDGDTAEPAFTAQLLAGFQLVDRCALPNWTDTAHELTVWERRAADGTQVQLEVSGSACLTSVRGAQAQSEHPVLIFACAADCFLHD